MVSKRGDEDEAGVAKIRRATSSKKILVMFPAVEEGFPLQTAFCPVTIVREVSGMASHLNIFADTRSEPRLHFYALSTNDR